MGALDPFFSNAAFASFLLRLQGYDTGSMWKIPNASIEDLRVSFNIILWILRLRVPESVQQIQQQLVTAQEIIRFMAKGKDNP